MAMANNGRIGTSARVNGWGPPPSKTTSRTQNAESSSARPPTGVSLRSAKASSGKTTRKGVTPVTKKSQR